MITRRSLLQFTAGGIGTSAVGIVFPAVAAGTTPLVDRAVAACRRLASSGWRQLLLDVTSGELDLEDPDLGTRLNRPLAMIDRTVPGFGDFDIAGARPIEPGMPERSLLYHAFAAPSVVAGRNGLELTAFPTLPEINAVEDFVYGAAPPSLEELRARASGHKLGIVAFAVSYRNAPDAVYGTHAQLCFSRAGIARLGTIEPFYDGRKRNFASLDENRPYDFRVFPCRFVAYVAVQVPGTWSRFGPQDRLPDDNERQFWVPLHKLFSGKECIRGLDLTVAFERGLRNDELGMFHRFLDTKGLENDFRGDALEEYPFTIKDEKIASLSRTDGFGAGVLVPLPQPLFSVAKYEGKDLAFRVDGSYSSQNVELSSLQVLPVGAAAGPLLPFANESSPDTQRPSPQYVNIRHRVNADGSISNLNHDRQLRQEMRAGGYSALHYIDGAGDGWVRATCQELAGEGIESVPAYITVGLPDFFPKVRQRDLMQWWKSTVPEPVRAALWVAPPLALSQTRIAANITLPIGFSLEDDTISAIVAEPRDALGPVQEPNGPLLREKTGLPDGSPGLFDPGWDTSQGIYYTDRNRPLQKFLAGYGLGSPFVEDAKLCAALGAYWPGVAPDATRTFAPDKQIAGIVYPYPTVAPQTDEELGMVPSSLTGKSAPWDGVPGPTVVRGEFRYAEYRDIWRIDYIDMLGTMTAALTSRVDLAEYKTRIMAMEAVYWSLGIHDPEFKDDPESIGDERQTATQKILVAKGAWAVLSFRPIPAGDSAMAEASQQTGAWPAAGPFFRVHVYRWGKQMPVADDMYRVRVEMLEEAIAYVAGTQVLLQRNGGSWVRDTSMPT